MCSVLPQVPAAEGPEHRPVVWAAGWGDLSDLGVLLRHLRALYGSAAGDRGEDGAAGEPAVTIDMCGRELSSKRVTLDAPAQEDLELRNGGLHGKGLGPGQALLEAASGARLRLTGLAISAEFTGAAGWAADADTLWTAVCASGPNACVQLPDVSIQVLGGLQQGKTAALHACGNSSAIRHTAGVWTSGVRAAGAAGGSCALTVLL